MKLSIMYKNMLHSHMLDLFFHELYIGYNVFVRCIFEEDLKQIQKFGTTKMIIKIFLRVIF